MHEPAKQPDSTKRSESAARARILKETWALIEAGRLADLTMGAVARAAGVSRQTVYVQFGSRTGLLVQMVRERDEANPRRERVAAAIASPDPVDGLVALTRALAGWWPEIHPAAHALHAAALTDEAARAAWKDRMAHLHEFTHAVVERLAEHDLLAHGWDPPLAGDWLAAQLNPLGWVLLVKDSGWAQTLYEDRMATIVQDVLLDPATRGSARDRSR
jgi:AcrR family transcriptional regulator